MWRLKNNNIVNEKGDVLDVSGGIDKEGQNVIVWKLHNGYNQQWTILYVDDDKPEPAKGELNKEFGLYVERAFYVVSEFGIGRYLDIVNNKLVIKTRNSYTSQLWYFDQTTKTIRSQRYSGKSWDISNSGKSYTVQVWKTNSMWW
jgi:hypothetical protein